MPGRIAVDPSPVAGLLRRLQGSAGWGAFVTDDLKHRMVRQLERIALDDETPAQTQVAAIACTMRASSLELEAVNTFARLYETTELERRIDELTRRLEPVTDEPEFASLVEPELSDIDPVVVEVPVSEPPGLTTDTEPADPGPVDFDELFGD